MIHYETEKAMATHSSILAWKLPWTEEPGGLQSMPWVCDQSNTAVELAPQDSYSGMYARCTIHFFRLLQCRKEGRRMQP